MMTDNDKLAMLRIWIGENADNNLLDVLLKVAAQKVIQRAYPYRNDIEVVPSRYEMVQLEIALNLYNKIGAEGQTRHTENGIDRSYESADIPDSILKKIVPYAGVV